MSSALKLPPSHMTLAEFLEWDSGDRTGARWQLRDGEPEMMAPASDRHGSIAMELGYLLTAHLRTQRSPCRAVSEAGVIPRIRSAENYRIPDIGITCTPATEAIPMPDPVALIEILSPSNERETRANIWAYTTIPSVQEIIVLRSTSIIAEILRRDPDGTWPEKPELLGPDDELRLHSIGFATPLREAYRTAGL